MKIMFMLLLLVATKLYNYQEVIMPTIRLTVFRYNKNNKRYRTTSYTSEHPLGIHGAIQKIFGICQHAYKFARYEREDKVFVMSFDPSIEIQVTEK